MLKFLIEKEFKSMLRNSSTPRFVLMMPLMTMLMMPWAATSDIKNVKVAVVDRDHTTYSARLVEKIAANPYFRLMHNEATYEAALREVEAGTADVIVEIPQYFEKNLENNNAATIFVASNAVNGMQGALGGSYITAMLGGYGAELSAEKGAAQMGGAVIETQPRYLFNETLDSKFFMIPALIVMLITMLCSSLPTMNIVSEKETGTIEQINVSPVSRWSFILAKVIPIWIVGFVALIIAMLISWGIYGLAPTGSVLVLGAGAVLMIGGTAGAGLVISSFSSNMQQSMFLMFFFVIIFLLTSGLFTPVRSMPDWAQYFTDVNPLKYYIEVTRMVYLKGSGFANLGVQFLALGVYFVAMNTWAVFSYSKRS